MGCDVHFYLEYCSKERREEVLAGKENGRGEKVTMYWQSLGGQLSMGRNYTMFGFLSQGVRSDFSDGFAPKGLPTDGMSWGTEVDAYLTINDKYAEDDNDGHYCTLANAERWATHGNKIYYNSDGTPWRVDHPDWHSHSWLTIEEYEQALGHYNKLKDTDEYWGVPEAYNAVLAAMKSLENDGFYTRVVFWFDN